MKSRLVYFLCIVALFTSCKDNYRILLQADNLPYLKGKWIHLSLDDHTPIDSVLVDRSTLLFSHLYSERYANHVAYISVSENKQIPLVLEPGNIEVNILDEKVSGTPLNDKLGQFSRDICALRSTYEKELTQLRQKMMASSTLSQEIRHLTDKFYAKHIEICSQYLTLHPNDPLGIHVALIAFLSYVETGDRPNLLPLIAKLGEKIKSNEAVNAQLHFCKNYISTLPGNKFVDVMCHTLDGQDTWLSNYMSNESYSLIYFGTPWCLLCKEEEIFMAKALHKYASRGLKVIAISSWNDRPNQGHWSDFSNDKWAQMVDYKDQATYYYGVQAVPHIMVIDSYGIIIKRNLHQNEIGNVLDSLYNIS